VKLIFFDEVKDSKEYPHYHLGAVCIDEANLSIVEEEISLLSEKVFETRVLGKNTEFHAAEIYHRKNNFKIWTDFKARIQIIERMLEVLTMDEVLLIDIQINCTPLSSSQLADEIAFMFLCERANDLVRRHKSLGMLIGDRENDKMSERFSMSLSEYRSTRTEFAYGRDIDNLVDSVHFTHSHLSRFLQLADIYVWIKQYINRHRGSKDIRHKAIFDILNKETIKLFPAKYKRWPKL